MQRWFIFVFFLLQSVICLAQNQIQPNNGVFIWGPGVGTPVIPFVNASYIGGYTDINGVFMGSTEFRKIVFSATPVGKPIPNGYNQGQICTVISPTYSASRIAPVNGVNVSMPSGCVFALGALGFWMDVPGPEGFQFPAIAVLNAPTAPWTTGGHVGAWAMDRILTETLQDSSGFPNGIFPDDLNDFLFTLDNNLNPINIEVPITLGIGATATEYYDRNNSTNTWNNFANTFGGGSTGRTIGQHTDTVTGHQSAFIMEDLGIFRGELQVTPTQKMVWNTTRENFSSTVGTYTACTPASLTNCTNLNAQFTGSSNNSPCGTVIPCNQNIRGMAFADCKDSSGIAHLFGSTGSQTWERQDGVGPETVTGGTATGTTSVTLTFAAIPTAITSGTVNVSGVGVGTGSGNPNGNGLTVTGGTPTSITYTASGNVTCTPSCSGGTVIMATPYWSLFSFLPNSVTFGASSASGQRAMSCFTASGSAGQDLIATVEGTIAKLHRISISASPGLYTGIQDMVTKRNTYCGVSGLANYVFDGYNGGDIFPCTANSICWPANGATAPPPPTAPPKCFLSTIEPNHMNQSGIWYGSNVPAAANIVFQLFPQIPGITSMISTRSMAMSQWPGDTNFLYITGYDANFIPAHNTGWAAKVYFPGVGAP